MDVKKTAKSVCKSVTRCSDVIKTDGNRRNNFGSKRCSGSKRRKAAWAGAGLRENRDHNAGNRDHNAGNSVTDKSVPESITGKITEEPAGEPMTEDLLNLEGFKVNSEGVIEGYENLDLILCDGMIIFPADERCSGIGEHALDGIPDAVEVYIPRILLLLHQEYWRR